jgi:valyl-tRNA synthetase
MENIDYSKKYNPKDFEERIYTNWEDNWKFKPRKSTTGEQFYIPMPPPNVTSNLHIGHSSMLSLQDIMTRYHRMKGDSTLLLPWTDHAGISTQVKVEEKLAKEGKSKHNMTREAFLDECWDWNKKYGWIIQNQFKKMWTSCDWSKEKFTLDNSMNKRVNKAFVDLYNKWLIYKWEYMVNYDPVLETVVSDQEVIHKEEQGKMYYITYFCSGCDNEVVIATTRPETLLGDVAVAVHPKDKRYKKMLKAGKKLILPLINKEIPLIADEAVDMDFWTGAVKITPAHDANDFAMAKRHDLPLENIVIWKDGKMSDIAWIFAGQDYKTARENIVELLKSKWNLIDIKEHISKVWYWERTWAKIETILSTQWFVKVEPLVKKVITGYKRKDFKIIPERYNKTFEDWVFNLRDWCISRQLLWGHQIPVWYNEAWEIFCAENEEDAQKQAGKWVKLTRDLDALDTWFSSALWPFATLDNDMWWGEQSDLMKKFYPANVLETGHDILFFWVIRMLLFWYEFTGETPFETIYLHGLVKDSEGKKMSKSLWNGIDPLEMIELHWTDALRLTLSIWNTPGNDLKFDEKNVINNKMFINKLWNASRFVYSKVDSSTEKDSDILEKILLDNYESLELHEKWILSKLKYLSDLVTLGMEKYNFSETGQELQIFTKNEFCDYYIEEFKLSSETSKFGNEVIIYTLNKLLKLWHPYIPFVTTEIYSKLWFEWDLIEAKWGIVNIKRNEKVEKEKDLMINIIKEIRNLRAENQILPSKTVWVKIYAKNKNADFLDWVLNLIAWIVKADTIELVDKKENNINLAYAVIKQWVEVYVDTSNAIDVDKESARFKEQISDTKEYVAILDKKLLNSSFVDRAPEHLVRAEMEKKTQAEDKLHKLEEKLNKLLGR